VIAPASGRPELAGKSVKQIAQLNKFKALHGNKPELMSDVALPDVSMEEQYRAVVDIYLAGGASAVFHTMDETEVANILRHPLVGVASDSGMRFFGQGQPHPRGYGTNARVLGRYVRELNVITLEDAVRKMTSMPATAFRIPDRGELRPGAFADIVIFDPDTVIDQATFDQPHQYPLGITRVLVNGQVVFDGANMTGVKSGQAVMGPGKGK
jgi:N-acyl-D-amino-acid deacylase